MKTAHRLKYIAFSIAFMLCSLTAYSAELLFSTSPSYDVKPSLEILQGSAYDININRLKTDEELQKGTSQAWRKFSQEHHGKLHYSNAGWLRFSITHVLQQDTKALLVLPNPSQDKISVYVTTSQDSVTYHTGSALPFSTRPINHPYFLFPLILPASSDIQVYIKANTNVASVAGSLELWSFSDYLIENSEQPKKWLFIGALSFCVVFLLANVFRRRQYDCAVLALYVFATLAAMVVYYGYAYQYVWPQSPELNYQSLYFFTAFSGASLIHFHSVFCRFKTHHRLAYIGSMVASFSLLLLAVLTIWGPYQGETRLLLLLGITVIFLLWQLVVLIRHELVGNKQHRPILVAWAITAAFSVLAPSIDKFLAIDLVPDTIELIVLTLCMSLMVMLLREGDKNLRNVASGAINMKVRDELMALMNFEVRTPMNAILGAADLLKGSQLTQSQRQYTELLHVSSRSLLRVVNDILDYSRLKTGNLVLHRKSFDLISLLDETPSIFSLRVSQKNIQLYCHFDRELPTRVLGDDNRLQQLLIYLLDYAIKLTHKGAVILLVYPDPEQPQRIVFTLEGDVVFQGETPIDVSKIAKFEPSFDEKASFGLDISNSIINQLIELMGATFSVVNGEQQKQRLDVSIPLPTVEKPLASLRPLSGASVGWVGADSLYASMLEKTAEQEGMQFYQFDSVDDFSQRMASNTYKLDAVLCYGDELDSESIKLLDQTCAKTSEQQDTTIKAVVLCDSIQALEWAEQQLVRFDLVAEKPAIVNNVFEQLAMVMQTENKGLLEQDLSNSSIPRLNILVAEDNEVNIMVLDRMLNRLGHQVSLVKNGALAVELYRHCMGSDERWQHFDLILMDCEMPEMDGLQATRKIRQLEAESAVNPVPIIALTAHGLSKIETQCMNAGMNVVLAKPVGLEKLKSAIERTVDLTKLVELDTQLKN